MIRKQLLDLYLKKNIEQSEAEAEIDLAIEIITGLSRKDLILGSLISKENEQLLKKAIERRLKTYEPLAHILGKAYFMNQLFKVTKDTLIPRPETELLVRKAIEVIEKNNYKHVLDLGTGSGCIACMLANFTKTQVLGIDISKNALNVALDNAIAMELFNKALFRKSDFFSNVHEKFDLIVSNPPYIPAKEKNNMQFDVLEYEPELALFTSDEHGIENYEKILSQAHNYLNPQGYVIFELGINQSVLISELLKFHGYKNIEIIKDLSGIDRVISAQSN